MSPNTSPKLSNKNIVTNKQLDSKNFNLKPRARPHELNSFFETYTKLDAIKSKMI